MKITFCGAAKKVTGSCYFIETSTINVVVDCGMHQGGKIGEEENFEPFPFDPTSVAALFITHAHLDHTGRIPKLVKDGFRGRIIATPPTVELAKLILEDSTRVLGHEALQHEHDPIYTEDDLKLTLPLFEEVDYHEKIQIDDNVTVEFFDAGHILGSACVRVTADGKSVVFSGDLGNPPVPLLKPTEIIKEADYVVMESTYGGRIHEDRENRRLLLRSAIYESVTMKGVLMIPAFAMERTQEILYELNDMVNNKDIPPVKIYLDSPLAIKATRVFQKFENYFNKATLHEIKSGDDVFNFPGLVMTESVDESKSINKAPNPKVIIAGSGMAQGGRILHHIERYITDRNSQYLIVGYQVNGSLGRKILDGDKVVKVKGNDLEVKAKVRAIGGYSAHADQPKLTTWISGFDKKQLKRVFITHGEEDQASALARHFNQSFEFDTIIPEFGETVDLD
ncbi:MAG: MBL fold hydrolase [Candidatus Kerfeldbacteria bacterium CG15_BIG_FIL_POST_REV_8_21_14_020_45_12]|uniref:MBL fold hydrolase n=1 Tax=Candidatus Kerfeldbacteria bacterium CG15_BIG_FIL_POST_REV_8_21_14_020_45_12 TaxID=2014247 RepID=A0A2M7H3K3_9BACT|nr:MAG: MBL fold hydrolase [Candidatus Kerfeldbacteria bacterium CG15_BIG_FIL_POST_REV_8_21_14_020_45_12]PJA93070.1 MAG: MBL fold hydrolase [Candidatus Kerfeldbacteria bacterium CG_4_9_14_3_um_filter_45_8]